MNVVFFTIIVPIYNVEQYLEKCIKSVLQQEKADFELLLVNDGSTDRSGEICMKYSTDSRVVVLHKENGGLSDARNYAHSYVGGKYVLYLDADDYIESKTFLCESKKILQDIPDADVLIYGYKKYFEDRKAFHVYLPRIKGPFLTCSFADAIEKNLPYEIKCPALLLCGERDHAGSCIRYNKAWHQNTNIPLEWIENAGHNSNTDQPEMVNRFIESLVQQIL